MLDVNSLRRSTIVAQEKNERILFQPLRTHRRHHLPHAVVEIRQHGRENAALDILDVRKTGHVCVLALERTVDRVVREQEEEGLVVVARHKIDGLSGEGIGQVCLLRNRLPAAEDRVVRIVVGLVIAHTCVE